MAKIDGTVLIVEDDKNFGTTLLEAFKREGLHAIHVTHPDEALNAFKIQHIDAFVFDCLLPSKSGVELAVQLRKLGATDQPMFFMSGIYKDKGFTKEALQKSNGTEFFTKPFELADLVSKIKSKLSGGESTVEELPLHALLSNPLPTPGDRLLAIEKTEDINGFELPWVLHLLMHPGISGILHLKDAAGKQSQIHFSGEKIVSVMIDDPKSFFGAILVENNFVRPNELEMALAKPSEKRVGERLVDENLISPHVIDIVNAEQTALRLSKLVASTTYDLQFEQKQIEDRSSSIDRNRFNRIVSDWVQSKVDTNYLKTLYLPRLNSAFSAGPSKKDHHPVMMLPPLSYFPELPKKFLDGESSLASILESQMAPEDQTYASLHLLLLSGQIVFKEMEVQQNLESMIGRLKKIESELETQTHFEILGINQRARPGDIKKAYHELAKVFHPDRVSSSSSSELKTLVDRVFSRMTKAYEVLSDETLRGSYLKELEQGQAEKILQSEALFEEGKVAMRAGQSSKALALFKEAIALRPPPVELSLHELWARMLCLSTVEDRIQELRDIEAGLNRVPPEERHSAIYYFVKGVFQKNLGNVDIARRSLQHAISLNPTFIEAKRELNVLNVAEDNKSVDLLRGDLKDVVGLLFKKKKKSG
ncbi:MAG: DnaJ domain-containing protein [Bdellovibrionales bacterium]|nr:DnaJ domain-containing protein [Bdellovibrionales bacterium]